MAKEMMIIFVYDMEFCKNEEDDPASAILYFHPTWVSDQQRTALCGQIMGTTHFLKSTFSCPKVLALQSGKFSIREFGRYILILAGEICSYWFSGDDRVVELSPKGSFRRFAKVAFAMFRLLFSVVMIITTEKSNLKMTITTLPKRRIDPFGDNSTTRFITREPAVGTDRNIDDWVLEHRADTLTSLISFFHYDLQLVSQQSQNYNNFTEKLYSMFETYLRILQYSGNIFSNAPLLQLPKSANNVFLEAIQILHYCQEMKSVLGGTMLYHNKVVATQLSSDLTKRLVMTDPYRIKSPAENVPTNFNLPLGVQLFHVYIDNKEYKTLQLNTIKLQTMNSSNILKNQKKILVPKALPKEPVLSAMKRDQSLIFTTVPEEDTDHQSPTNIAEKLPRTIKTIADRPKSLSLKTSITDTKINKPESVVSTPFTGKTSVCSTPLAEKFLFGTSLSICCNPDIDLKETNDTVIAQENVNKVTGESSIESSHKTMETTSESVNSILSTCSALDLAKKPTTDVEDINKIMFPVTNIIVPLNFLNERRYYSMIESAKYTNDTDTMRCYGIGLTNMNKIVDSDVRNFNKTIADPSYPVFRADGKILSKQLYDKYLSNQCELLTSELENEFSKDQSGVFGNEKDSVANTEEWMSVDGFDSEMKDSPLKSRHTESEVKDISSDEGCSSFTSKVQETKRTLNLPLKSLSFEQNNENSAPSIPKRNLGGVQLTPLMSKLSLLAFEERSSGFCSRDSTPSEFREFGLTPSEKNYSFLSRKNSIRHNNEEDLCQDLQKVILFICGQQDMVLGLLLEDDAANNSDLIQRLWEVCTETLNRLEVQLRQCLDPYPVASADPGETYSYLCLEPQWDTVQRGGPWGVAEVGALTHLHRDFTLNQNVTDIILRNEDGIIYGYHCGNTEVYYQQSASSNAGLPPPTDPMGMAPLKAKRKLERDHTIILL